MEFLFGHKTTAFFDIWTLEHFIVGISIGAFALFHTRKKLKGVLTVFEGNGRELPKEHRSILTRFDLVSVLFLAFAWEAIEHYLETGIAGPVIMHWFQGVEAWHNRLLADPLTMVVGYTFVKRLPWLVWPARFFSLAWVYLHVFIFPHSMYLQDLLWRAWHR